MARKIIHIDADAFYASVEERDNPALREHPVAVGGNPHGRGVVATCNYIARQFGVRSAMPSAQALKLCPNLIFIKPRFDAYREASRKMHQIFHDYTHQIEPLSLDEAYLDVSECKQHKGSGTLIAQSIQSDILNEVGLSVSAGVAPNKFLAKIASDWKKPHGIFVITPDKVSEFVRDLPVKKINGVGKVTAAKLNRLGIQTCADIQNVDQSVLTEKFGKYGERLYKLARGIDRSEVQVTRQRKSLSVERTLASNLNTEEELLNACDKLFQELLTRSKKLDSETQIKGIFVKLKFANFKQTTLEHSTANIHEDWQQIRLFKEMILEARARQQQAIRLIGMGVRIATPSQESNQLSLFES